VVGYFFPLLWLPMPVGACRWRLREKRWIQAHPSSAGAVRLFHHGENGRIKQ